MPGYSRARLAGTWKNKADGQPYTPVDKTHLEKWDQRIYDLARGTVLYAKDYGAVGDLSADDTSALTAVLADLPAGGGRIVVPYPGCRFTSQLNLDGLLNVQFEGVGGRAIGGDRGSRLQYDGTGSGSAISAKSTIGTQFRNLQVTYTSSSFTGILVDLRNTSGSSANDTILASFSDFFIGSYPSNIFSAACLVHLGNAHSISFRDGIFVAGAPYHVIGRAVAGDYSNVVLFDHITHYYSQTAHLKNAGQAWTSLNCTYEPRADTGAGTYTHDAGIRAEGLHFINPWCGDVLTGAGQHIKFSGDGLRIDGGAMGVVTAGAKNIVIDENNCNGIVILGTDGIGPGGPFIDFGATTGHGPSIIIPGALTGGMAKGTVPDNTFGMDAFGMLLGTVPIYKTPGFAELNVNNDFKFGTKRTIHAAAGVDEFVETTDPAAPATNGAYLYARDNGAGKTQLVVRFPTGAIQVLSTEP